MASASDAELLKMFNDQRHHHLVRAANRIAPRLAGRAYQHDKDASFPFNDYTDLRAARLLGLTIPKRHGGTLVSPLVRAAVLAQLAEASGPTALTFVMHLTCAGFVAAVGNDEVKNIILPAVTKNGALLASCTSEPKKTFRGPYRLDTEFIPEKDGVRVVGNKNFATLAGAAAYYLVNGKLRGSNSTKEGFMLAAIPARDVRITQEWNAIGMRATASHAIEFDAFVPNSLIIGRPGQLLETDEFTNFMFGYAAVGIGLSIAALKYTKEVTFQTHRVMGRRDAQIVQELEALIDQCKVHLTAAAIAKQQKSKEATTLTAIAKYHATEAAPEITWRCIKLAGGRGILKGENHPLERWHRDSLCGALMPSPNIRIEETDFGSLAPLIEWS